MKKEITTQEQAVDLTGLKGLISNLNHRLTSADLVPLLQQTQDLYGYLPRTALELLSQETRISLSKIFGVATFYAQFSFIPKGKYTIRVCDGTACHVRGAAQVKAKMEEILNIREGETTPDLRFTLESVACLGTCALGPVVVVGNSKKPEGCCQGPLNKKVGLGDKFYGQVSPERVRDILDRYTRE